MPCIKAVVNVNRTDKITVTTGSGQYIYYTYDATGKLIRKQAYNSSTLQTTTDYIDGFVYITVTTGSPVLAYFPMPEGRALNTGTGGTVTLTQEFIITDQQGNARVSFKNNGSNAPVVTQENSYYGFGLILPNSPVATTATSNKQLYNGGSEWQNDYSNLPDYYQTYYRNYDAALARWVGVDPMAESAESMTVYHYSGNNPIMYNDPLGDIGGAAPKNSSGQYYWNYNNVAQPTAHGQSQQSAGGLDNSLVDQLESDADNLNIQFSSEGLYYSNPDAYWAYYDATNGTLGGTSIYHAGNGTSTNPSTGSLQTATGLINSVSMSEGMGPLIMANRFDNYVGPPDGSVIHQSAYMSDDPGSYFYSAVASELGGQTIFTGTGDMLDDITSPILFNNEKDAYNFMWQKTLNADGTAYKEVSGFLTNFGVLVLPNVNNTNSTSVNEFMYNEKTKRSYIKYNNLTLTLYAGVHTHPNGWNDILSDPQDLVLYSYRLTLLE